MFALCSIDVTKVKKEWLRAGKNGQKYLDIVIKDAKDDKYGNDYMVTQSVPKEQREQTKYGPILGNGKNFSRDDQPPKPKQKAPESIGSMGPGGPVVHYSAPSDDVPF